MSQLLVDDIVNKDDSGAVSASKGLNVSGIATLGISSASQFEVAGVTTVYSTTESTATNDGALVISGGVGIAKSLNVGGNVTVGGTLTYEDVTNVDSVGIVTGRIGFYAGTTQGSGTGIGATILNTGNAVFAGIVTATTLKYGSTSVETAIDAKASLGKAIAMAMDFG